MYLLMIEKDPSISDSQVCDDRDSVVRADNADEAMSILRHEKLDLVVIDVVSLAEEGWSFIRRLRSMKNDIPLVALTGSQAADRVRALGLGADDAIAQPVDPSELRARIRAVARRHKGYSQSLVRLGDLTLSLETREVRFREVQVHLTAREYSILELLVLRKGQVITKDMFLNHLYGSMDEPETKIVDVFICKLRRKLNDVGAHGLIGTVWGLGYVVRIQKEQVRMPDVPVPGCPTLQGVKMSDRIQLDGVLRAFST
jgi:two-component system, cell cycle response regulator CtrA